MDDNAFDDIMDAVARLRIAFLKHGMSAPASIEIGHVKDGYWFRWAAPKDMVHFAPRMGETAQDAEWVCNIQGVEIRMPAQWRGVSAGRSVLYEPEFFNPPTKGTRP